MKIYIVVGNYDYKPSTILGAFDSKESATIFANSINKFDFISVEEIFLKQHYYKKLKD